MRSAAISVAAPGDTTIVAAPDANKFIRVHSYSLIAGGTVNVTWKSGSTAKTGPLPLIVNSGSNDTARDGCFDCAPGEALVLSLSAGIQVSGRVEYAIKG
jgi:hypothetical protein